VWPSALASGAPRSQRTQLVVGEERSVDEARVGLREHGGVEALLARHVDDPPGAALVRDAQPERRVGRAARDDLRPSRRVLEARARGHERIEPQVARAAPREAAARSGADDAQLRRVRP
jgi:hypothetical protein